MVVFEGGAPKKSDYRRFKVKTLDNQDDFASMEEVLTRRFRRYLEDAEGAGDLDLSTGVTLGHSAGGHLAAWAAARQVSRPPQQ